VDAISSPGHDTKLPTDRGYSSPFYICNGITGGTGNSAADDYEEQERITLLGSLDGTAAGGLIGCL